MKRWTLRILLCLILGAVTTVAVAWGLAMKYPAWSEDHLSGSRNAGGIHLEYYKVEAPGSQGASIIADRTRSGNDSGPAPGEIVPSWLASTDPTVAAPTDGFDTEVRWGEARGWPFLALTWSARDRGGSTFGSKWEHDIGGIETGWEWPDGSDKRLPLRPAWPGFVLDTLFYAAIWGSLFFVPGVVRRFIRVKRGRCPRCGYDLRGNLDAGCPECGWGRGAD